jgi:hypothetical protein
MRSNIITNVLIRQSTFLIASRTLPRLEKEGVGHIGENLRRKTLGRVNISWKQPFLPRIPEHARLNRTEELTIFFEA